MILNEKAKKALKNLTETDKKVLGSWVAKQRRLYPQINKEAFDNLMNEFLASTRFIKESKEEILTESELRILEEGLMDWIKKGWGAITSAISTWTSKLNDKAQKAIVDSVNDAAVKKNAKLQAALKQVLASAKKALDSPTLGEDAKKEITAKLEDANGQLELLKKAMSGEKIFPEAPEEITTETNAAGEAALAAQVEAEASTDEGATKLVKDGVFSEEQLVQLLTFLEEKGVKIGQKSEETVAEENEKTQETTGVDPIKAASFIAKFLKGSKLNVTLKDGSSMGVPLAEQDDKAIESLANNLSKMVKDKQYCAMLCPTCTAVNESNEHIFDPKLIPEINQVIAKDIVDNKLTVNESIDIINSIAVLTKTPPRTLIDSITQNIYKFNSNFGKVTLKEGLQLKANLENAAGVLGDINRHFNRLTAEHRHIEFPKEDISLIKESTTEEVKLDEEEELIIPDTLL